MKCHDEHDLSYAARKRLQRIASGRQPQDLDLCDVTVAQVGRRLRHRKLAVTPFNPNPRETSNAKRCTSRASELMTCPLQEGRRGSRRARHVANRKAAAAAAAVVLVNFTGSHGVTLLP